VALEQAEDESALTLEILLSEADLFRLGHSPQPVRL